MIKKIVLLPLVFIAISGFSQEDRNWNKLLLDKNESFEEISKKFHEEWDGKEYSKGKGWKQFKRWEAFWENRLMPDGSFPDFGTAFEEYSDFNSAFQNQSSPPNGNWLPLGPFDHITTGSWSSGTGRVNVVVQHPFNPNIIYVGAPAGGIWKSVNAGVSWTPLSDDLAVIGISGIAINPDNTDEIYVTTGDSDGGNTYSIGVWKSINGGNTWGQAGNNFGQGNKILIDPENPATIYVASNAGLYKSSNSGSSWNQIQSGNIRDIALKPGDSQVIYAVTASTCYVSTNGGNTFSTSTGLPGGTNRLAVTVSPAAANVVYVLAAANDWTFQGVYKSVDSGASFTAQNTTTDIFNGSSQAWYDMAITVSDTDPNTLLAGVLNVWRSTNGGVSWTGINSWSNPSGASYTHADIHYLNYYNGNLYCGSDGGVYRSTNNGNSFTDLSDGLQIGQYYTIAGSQNDANTLCGGLQDNGGYAYTDGTWKCYYGADGMGSAVNSNNSDQIWGMIQNGSLYYTSNGGFNLSSAGSPESGRWITPMSYDGNNSRIVAGYNDVYEYVPGSGWNQLSTYNFPSLLSIVEVYEANSNIMYASSGSDLARTNDGGTTFTNITLPFNSSVTSLEINPSNSNEIWITQSGWTNGQKVYRSLNGGVSWENISFNLPNIPTNIIKFNSSNNGIYLGMDIGVYYYNDLIGNWIPFNENLPNVIVNDIEINEANDLIRIGTYGRGVWESGVYDVVQYDTDVMVLSLDSPEGTYCQTETEASLVVRNIGTSTLTSMTIEYDTDGGTTSSYTWNGSLAIGTNTTINIPTFNSTDGAHTFTITVLNPNGLPDENTDNNSITSTYQTILNGTAVTFNLITDCYGYETGWNLNDDLGGVLYSTLTGSLSSETNYSNEFCLSDGCYELVINDSYGDGLSSGACSDGNYSVIDDQGITLVSMSLANFGLSVSESFCAVAPSNSGCTSITACNYSSSATIDDGSCTEPTIWYYDADGDGYGDDTISSLVCNQPSNFVAINGDCMPLDNAIYPGVSEVCDGIDNNCDGQIDEGFAQITYYEDLDADGYGSSNSVMACSPQGNFNVTITGDCNDNDIEVNPARSEICGNGIDDNCNEQIDENQTIFYTDSDLDGFGDLNAPVLACTPSAGIVTNSSDCDDTRSDIYPSAPSTNEGVDNDCNGQIDSYEALECLGDFNSDGLISIDDILILLSDFGCSGVCETDLNSDNFVNTADIGIFLGLFGTYCE